MRRAGKGSTERSPADVLNCLVELSRIYFDVDQYGTIRERKVKRWHERLADFFKKKEGKNK
jgi:hypothetical protein